MREKGGQLWWKEEVRRAGGLAGRSSMKSHINLLICFHHSNLQLAVLPSPSHMTLPLHPRQINKPDGFSIF
jgi:hypothetical protein